MSNGLRKAIREAEESIEVGRVVGKDAVFIAVPKECHERIVAAATGKRKHAFKFTFDEARWLIDALERELP